MDKLDLEAIDYIMASSKLKFSNRSFIYTFTNECIKDYLNFFELKSKEILTVTGSGDHILNMLLDVDSIDTFDINLYAYYFYILKSYALITLELDEYLDFFLDKEIGYNKKTFDKIKQNWQDDINIRDFFDYVFKNYYVKHTTLFTNNKYQDREKFIKNNTYLEEENYYRLKNNLLNKKVNFINSNLTKLNLEKQYDYIFISNITDYLNNMFNNDPLKSYKKFLYKSIIPYLKENGKLVSYLYDGKIVGFTNDELDEILKYGFDKKEVNNDKILIYTKGGIWKNI